MVLASVSHRRQAEAALDPLFQSLYTRLELFRGAALKRRRSSWETSRIGRWFQTLSSQDQLRLLCIQDQAWVALFLEMAKVQLRSRTNTQLSPSRWRKRQPNTAAFSIFDYEASKQVRRLKKVNKRVRAPEYTFRRSQLGSARYEAFAETLTQAQAQACAAAQEILARVCVFAGGSSITFSPPQPRQLFALLDAVSYFNFLRTDGWSPPAAQEQTFARTPWFERSGWVSLAAFLCNRLEIQLRQRFAEAASPRALPHHPPLHNDFRFASYWRRLSSVARSARVAAAAKRHPLPDTVRKVLGSSQLSELLHLLPQGSSDLAFDLVDAARLKLGGSLGQLAVLACLACRTAEGPWEWKWEEEDEAQSPLGLPFVPLDEYVSPVQGLVSVYVEALCDGWRQELLEECLVEEPSPERGEMQRKRQRQRKKRRKKKEAKKKESEGSEESAQWLFEESSPFFGAQLDIWSDICSSSEFLAWRPVTTAALPAENAPEQTEDLDKVIAPMTPSITTVTVGTQTDVSLELESNYQQQNGVRGRERKEEEREKEWTLISKRRRRPQSADVRAKEKEQKKRQEKHQESSPRSSPGGTMATRRRQRANKEFRKGKQKQSARSLSFSEGRENGSGPFSPENYPVYARESTSTLEQNRSHIDMKEEPAEKVEDDEATKAAVEEVCKHFDRTVGKLHDENAELRTMVMQLVGKVDALEQAISGGYKGESAASIGVDASGQVRRKSTIGGSKQFASGKGEVKMMPDAPMKMLSESNLVSPTRKAGTHHNSWAQDDFDVWQPSYLSQSTTLPPANVYYSMSPPSHYAYLQHQHHNAAGLLYTHPGQVADMSFLASPLQTQTQTQTQSQVSSCC